MYAQCTLLQSATWLRILDTWNCISCGYQWLYCHWYPQEMQFASVDLCGLVLSFVLACGHVVYKPKMVLLGRMRVFMWCRWTIHRNLSGRWRMSIAEVHMTSMTKNLLGIAMPKVWGTVWKSNHMYHAIMYVSVVQPDMSVASKGLQTSKILVIPTTIPMIFESNGGWQKAQCPVRALISCPIWVLTFSAISFFCLLETHARHFDLRISSCALLSCKLRLKLNMLCCHKPASCIPALTVMLSLDVLPRICTKTNTITFVYSCERHKVAIFRCMWDSWYTWNIHLICTLTFYIRITCYNCLHRKNHVKCTGFSRQCTTSLDHLKTDGDFDLAKYVTQSQCSMSCFSRSCKRFHLLTAVMQSFHQSIRFELDSAFFTHVHPSSTLSQNLASSWTARTWNDCHARLIKELSKSSK